MIARGKLRHHRHRRLIHGRGYFSRLGPGFVTGAADDDPSGIGTYVQVGARFGTSLLWAMPLLLPLAIAVQELAARIGLTTGHGLAHAVRKRSNRVLLWSVVVTVAVANTLNVAADLAAMGAAVRLLVPVSSVVTVITIGCTVVILDIVVPYQRSARVLRWLACSLLAYPLVLVFESVAWRNALHSTFAPNISLERQTIAALIALFGTTVSPYLYFWQASEEVEENKGQRRVDRGHIRAMRTDVASGMGSAIIAAWAIILVGSASLHDNGITDVASAAAAADALRPVAGDMAGFVFALGIVGLGLLAIPVLAGSTAYAVAEASGWSEGLSQRWRAARGFYGVIIVSIAVAIVIDLAGLDPMRGLFLAAVANGLAAPPLILVMLFVARDREQLGSWRAGWAASFGALAAAIVSIALPCWWLVIS